MLTKLLRTSALLIFAAVLAFGAAPQEASAELTPEQSATLAKASDGGAQALATELAVQVLADPSAWEDLLAQALALDPDSAPLFAATLALLLPVEAVNIAEAAGGASDPIVVAAVASAVPAAEAELEAAFGPIDSGDSEIANAYVNQAENARDQGQQLADAGTTERESDLQNDSSSLQDDETPSPN